MFRKRALAYCICGLVCFIVIVIVVVVTRKDNHTTEVCESYYNVSNWIDKIDLTNWELQLPVAGGLSIEIIPGEELMAGYQSEYFYKKNGILTFWCPSNGATTEHSLDPRSELREIGAGENWTLSGRHMLTASCAVLVLPVANGIVIGQIHGSSESQQPQLCKIYWKTDNTLIAQVKSDDDPTGPEIDLFLGNYCLGQPIKYTLLLVDFVLKIDVYSEKDGQQIVYSVETSFLNSYWSDWGETYYFKAGNYLQDHINNDNGTVQFYNLSVQHSSG